VVNSTGFSQAFLMQGREPRLPTALSDEDTPGSATSALDPKEKQGRLKKSLISFTATYSGLLKTRTVTTT